MLRKRLLSEMRTLTMLVGMLWPGGSVYAVHLALLIERSSLRLRK
jgi:hypothetical protein